jgi:uncharacterized protein YbjT (DUF2867 family)
MHILLTGPTGFIGTQVLAELIAARHLVTCVVHNQKAQDQLKSAGFTGTIVLGDVSKKNSLQKVDEYLSSGQIEAIIYLPGLLREFPSKGITFQGVHFDGVKNLVGLAKKHGIRRWLQMSALGASKNSTTGYFKTKWAAEELLRTSGLDWTIFRPSVIFSDTPTTRMNFAGELGNVAKMAPFLPVFGDGKYRLQPVSIQEVVGSMVRALKMPETIGQTYELGGPEKLSYNEVMIQIATAMGKRKPIVHIPFWMVRPIASLLDGFSFFPVTNDQLTMLLNENIVHDANEEAKFARTFGMEQMRFSTGMQGYFAKR